MLARLSGRLCGPLVLLALVTALPLTACRRRSAHRPADSLPASSASSSPTMQVIQTSTPGDGSPSSGASGSSGSSAPTGASDASQMSEAERKAAARAAFAEGVAFQDKRDCAQAIPRFETAQRLYDAPTHLLHLAQCNALMGRLVEATELYSTLAHMTLTPEAPRAFRDAKESGRVEHARLAPRVPTLRVETSPSTSSLKNVVVKVNGTQMPADLLGVARPLNPGRYRVTVTASPSRSGTGEMELKEGEAKSLEVKLSP
jgi:hypothetical protein